MDSTAITSAAQAVHQELVSKLAEQADPGGPVGHGLDSAVGVPGSHRLPQRGDPARSGAAASSLRAPQ